MVRQRRRLLSPIAQLIQRDRALKQTAPPMKIVNLEYEEVSQRTGNRNEEDDEKPIIIHAATMGVHQHPEGECQLDHGKDRIFRHQGIEVSHVRPVRGNRWNVLYREYPTRT